MFFLALFNFQSPLRSAMSFCSLKRLNYSITLSAFCQALFFFFLPDLAEVSLTAVSDIGRRPMNPRRALPYVPASLLKKA